MNEKINSIIKNLNENNKPTVQDFVQVIDDMRLNEEHKLAGLVYLSLNEQTLSSEEIAIKYSQNISEIVETLQKRDGIN